MYGTWVNKDGHYPYVSRETWRHRGWLLDRKVAKYGSATANDRRVAMLLLSNERYASSDVHLKPRLEEIAYGSPEDLPEEHSSEA